MKVAADKNWKLLIKHVLKMSAEWQILRKKESLKLF